MCRASSRPRVFPQLMQMPINHHEECYMSARPFRILGLQQIAIGGTDKKRLRKLWVDTLGVPVTGQLPQRARERRRGHPGAGDGTDQGRDRPDAADRHRQEARRPRNPAQPHRTVGRRSAEGGGVARRRTACVSPRAASARAPQASTSASCTRRATTQFPISGEGVLIELVQAPPEVVATLGT